MFDSDLARLYGVETNYLKRTVKANIERFPSDFMLELYPAEFNSLRGKTAPQMIKSQRGGTNYCVDKINKPTDQIPFDYLSANR